MFRKTASTAMCALLLLSLGASIGCQATFEPAIWPGGALAYPIPISPYLQDKLEDRAWNKERYDRVPILGPITAGGPVVALDPPSDDEIMRAFEAANPTEGGLPFLHEVQRNNVKIVVEPIADYIDPVRVYPLVGPAQQHHAHYKCIIHYSEKTRVGWPIPHTIHDEECQEVVYIDHNQLHQVGNVTGGPGSNYQ